MSSNKISNKPPISLLPNNANLSQYMVIFPDYSINRGNMLAVEPTGNMFSGNYPHYLPAIGLREDPSAPVVEKFYSMDNDITSQSDPLSLSSSGIEEGSNNSCGQ